MKTLRSTRNDEEPKKTALGANPGGFSAWPKRLYALAAGAALR
jgi:hypothetical protein